jgi:hypothetical protein
MTEYGVGNADIMRLWNPTAYLLRTVLSSLDG